MRDKLSRLLSLASGPQSGGTAESVGSTQLHIGAGSGRLGGELIELLALRNGFYAFESALLLRPFDSNHNPLGILQWNEPSVWKSAFKVGPSEAFFFAEDIFGVQFCIKDNAVNSFNPETAEFNFLAKSIEEWAGWILEESKTRTGWPMAHFWQLRNGPITPGTRLTPKVPFVLGGAFAIENLSETNDVEGMRFRASIANQLLDCPDGSKVIVKIKRN